MPDELGREAVARIGDGLHRPTLPVSGRIAVTMPSAALAFGEYSVAAERAGAALQRFRVEAARFT
jgi:hypothetical protein